MKNRVTAIILALSLLALASTQLTTAQTEGPFATGNYLFILEDDVKRSVEFDARADREGNATGFLTYTDQVKFPDQDVDGTGEGGEVEGPSDFYIKVDLDTLAIEKNRALLSGTVSDSSHKIYIGQFVQLVVEDNAENRELPDTLTWRVCRPMPGGWIPSDSEVPGDQGAFLSWWATDSEQKDDVGIPSPSVIPGELKACLKFPFAAYDFVQILKFEGDIKVQP